jgi:hypothetical protein
MRAALLACHLRVKIEAYLVRHDGEKTRLGGRSATLLRMSTCPPRCRTLPDPSRSARASRPRWGHACRVRVPPSSRVGGGRQGSRKIHPEPVERCSCVQDAPSQTVVPIRPLSLVCRRNQSLLQRVGRHGRLVPIGIAAQCRDNTRAQRARGRGSGIRPRMRHRQNVFQTTLHVSICAFFELTGRAEIRLPIGRQLSRRTQQVRPRPLR